MCSPVSVITIAYCTECGLLACVGSVCRSTALPVVQVRSDFLIKTDRRFVPRPVKICNLRVNDLCRSSAHKLMQQCVHHPAGLRTLKALSKNSCSSVSSTLCRCRLGSHSLRVQTQAGFSCSACSLGRCSAKECWTCPQLPQVAIFTVVVQTIHDTKFLQGFKRLTVTATS